jgi:small basic protein (TIGR04137 family)
MSIDRTLKVHGGLLRTRSVLTRAERIAQLTDEGKFDPEADSPFGLPKVRVRRSKAGTKAKKAPAEEPVPEVEGEPSPESADSESPEQESKTK